VRDALFDFINKGAIGMTVCLCCKRSVPTKVGNFRGETDHQGGAKYQKKSVYREPKETAS
jgi:hypothetical protein